MAKKKMKCISHVIKAIKNSKRESTEESKPFMCTKQRRIYPVYPYLVYCLDPKNAPLTGEEEERPGKDNRQNYIGNLEDFATVQKERFNFWIN